MLRLILTFSCHMPRKNSFHIARLTLRGIDTPLGETTVKLLLAPFRKEVYSFVKEFAPVGRKCFPLRIDSFLEGTWSAGTKQKVIKFVFLVTKNRENLSSVSCTLKRVLLCFTLPYYGKLLIHNLTCDKVHFSAFVRILCPHLLHRYTGYCCLDISLSYLVFDNLIN